MKKFAGILTSVITVLTAIAMLAVLVSANETLKPTDYSAYGQQTLKAEFGGVPATVDGKIADGEYTNKFEFKAGTPTFNLPDADFPGYPTSIEVYVTMDETTIWLGFAIHEAFMQPRVGSTAGSYMAFTIGPDMGNAFYQSMNRNTLTLNMVDDGSLFKANTVMIYDAAGKSTTSYNSNVYKAAAGVRDEAAGITYYEVEIDRACVAQNNNLEKMEDKWYFHFEHKAYANAAMKSSDSYRCVLSDEAKAAAVAADGWVASFVPNIIDFTADTPVETKPQDTTPVAPVTDPIAPVTEPQTPATEPVKPTPSTGDSITAIAAVAVLAAAVAGSVLVLNRKHDN